MWEEAQQVVKSIFFKDVVNLYQLSYTQSELGEDIEQLVLVGSYHCNIENGQNQLSSTESGQSYPQSLRISLPKDTPLSYGSTYAIKIVQARIVFDANTVWTVKGWVEGQISTVIDASREVAV